MGSASKVISAILRIGELVCSVIVVGIVGSFLWRVGQATSAYADARLIFALVVASISTVLSVLLLVPFTFTFFACPLDFIFFALWLVVFILLELLTGVDTCHAVWYYDYWGYYWGGFWRNPFIVTGPWDIDWVGCGSWKAVLAWSFIASMTYLFSSVLGIYVVVKYREEKKAALRGHGHPHKVEQGALQNGSH